MRQLFPKRVKLAAPTATLGDVAVEYAAPRLSTPAVTAVLIKPAVVAPPGSSPAAIEAASRANETPFAARASPAQKSIE